MLTLLFGLALAKDLDGAQVYRDNCGRCHNARPPSELGAEQWPAVVFHMRTRAMLTVREADAVLAFLAPPPPPPAVGKSKLFADPIVATKCVLCHDPSRIDAAVAAGHPQDWWVATLQRMNTYGAGLSHEQMDSLAAWLATQR